MLLPPHSLTEVYLHAFASTKKIDSDSTIKACYRTKRTCLHTAFPQALAGKRQHAREQHSRGAGDGSRTGGVTGTEQPSVTPHAHGAFIERHFRAGPSGFLPAIHESLVVRN